MSLPPPTCARSDAQHPVENAEKWKSAANHGETFRASGPATLIRVSRRRQNVRFEAAF